MGNEITVKLNYKIEDIYKILENKNFRAIQKFSLDDTYFIPKKLEINNISPREILTHAVLLRNITEYNPHKIITLLTFKEKQINDKGIILNQNSVNCKIIDAESGRKFIEAIGYKEIMRIKENDVVYEKDGLQLAVKDIENGDNLIEVETVEENNELDTTEKLIEKINGLQLPIENNDYFVKKAEIELEKYLINIRR